MSTRSPALFISSRSRYRATATSGVWSYNPATDVLTELWEKQSRLTSRTARCGPSRIPDANMWKIEVDEIGGRLFIGTMNSTNHENDGTPATNEHDASIHVLAIGAAPQHRADPLRARLRADRARRAVGHGDRLRLQRLR